MFVTPLLSSDGCATPQGTILPRGRRCLSPAWLVGLAIAGWLFASGLMAMAQPIAPAGAGSLATNELIRRVGPGRYEIGKIQLDQEKATLRFPAQINQKAGPIEYLLVADYGKIHESLLRTDVPPYHVQLALLLLGAKPQGTNNPEASPSPSARSRKGELSIAIAWKSWGLTRRKEAGSFIRDRRAGATIERGHWKFVGSQMRENGFAAQLDGSIITVIDDADAIVGNSLPNSDDDDNWEATGRKLPGLDAKVEVILTWHRAAEIRQP